MKGDQSQNSINTTPRVEEMKTLNQLSGNNSQEFINHQPLEANPSSENGTSKAFLNQHL